MHRKSLEAAEALKNEDNASDKEDTQSKASDVSSVDNPSSSKATSSTQKQSSKNATAHQPNMRSNVGNNEVMSSRHSVSPMSPTGPPSHITSSPVSTTKNSNVDTVTPPPQQQQPAQPPSQSSSMPPSVNVNHLGVSSPSHAHFHPDSDPEAFRWVEYNRDPISFIRCDFVI